MHKYRSRRRPPAEHRTPVLSTIRITGAGFASPTSATSFLLESGCEPSTHEVVQIEEGCWIASGIMAHYLSGGR